VNRYDDKIQCIIERSRINNTLGFDEQEKQMKYVTSIERFVEARGFEQAFEKGFEKGLKKGQGAVVRVLTRLLRRQFRNVPDGVETRLKALSIDHLEMLVEVALSVNSLDAFVEALPDRSVEFAS
jgi:flagellar biosynthesis/type III secretory pathway protein FliH